MGWIADSRGALSAAGFAVALILPAAGASASTPPHSELAVKRTAALQGLKSTEVRGFTTGMALREVASRIPLRPLGGGDFEAVQGDTKFGFGFTPLGNLYRIDTQQKLGFFHPDRATAQRLTEQLSAKFGTPDFNQLPGGPVTWSTYAQVLGEDGRRLNREVQSLSVMFQESYDQPVELWIKLVDFRILWRDAQRQNAAPKAKAEDALRF
jgi:hypothetical protein